MVVGRTSARYDQIGSQPARDYGTASSHAVRTGYDYDLELRMIERLPPMPEPDRTTRMQESCTGCFLVTGIVVVLVLITHIGSLRSGTLEGGVWWFFFLAIYTEAAIAMFCLFVILYGDPGVIRRSPETCFPLPELVKERLDRGEALDGLDNLSHEQLGSYCVRCCVWRPPSAKLKNRGAMPDDCDMSVCENGSHHCRTCGRCVVDFDQCAPAASPRLALHRSPLLALCARASPFESRTADAPRPHPTAHHQHPATPPVCIRSHCGVFGRCIAGQCTSGNLPFFYALIAMGWVGFATTMAAVLMSGVKLTRL